jgi:hypothetical protein
MKLTRPPFLSIIMDEEGPTLRDPSVLLSWRTDDLMPILRVLDICGDKGLEAGQLQGFLTDVVRLTPAAAIEAIDFLIANDLLVPADEAAPLRIAGQSWQREGWEEAFVFHLHTNRIPKMDYSADPTGVADKELMRTYLSAEPPPRLANRRDGPFREFTPTGAVAAGELWAALLDDVGRSRRGRSLSYEELSEFVWLAFGQIANKRLPLSGEHICRTSPSGGSRHPTETYVIAL